MAGGMGPVADLPVTMRIAGAHVASISGAPLNLPILLPMSHRSSGATLTGAPIDLPEDMTQTKASSFDWIISLGMWMKGRKSCPSRAGVSPPKSMVTGSELLGTSIIMGSEGMMTTFSHVVQPASLMPEYARHLRLALMVLR